MPVCMNFEHLCQYIAGTGSVVNVQRTNFVPSLFLEDFPQEVDSTSHADANEYQGIITLT